MDVRIHIAAQTSAFIVLLIIGLPVWGQDDTVSAPSFSAGPNDVPQIINRNDKQKSSLFIFPQIDKAISPWLNFKSKLNDDYGFKLGTDYQFLYQDASNSIDEDEDDASGGAYRLFFDWTLFKRESNTPGSIIFKMENRHSLWTNIPPEELGNELGYAGITGTGYGDFGWGVTDLYWKQQFLSGNGAEVRLGRLAPTAYFDVTLHSDPYTNFTNFSLNFTPTIAYPADGSLGAALWLGVTKNFYILGTVLDANSDTTKSGFETIDEKEFFSGIEFGWANRGATNSFVDNVHVSLWHSDKREDAGVPSSKGVGLTGSWLFGEDSWSPFVRLGWSDGDASLLEKSVAMGVGFNLTARNDLIGIGGSWGQSPLEDDEDQYTAEMFYRLQIAQNLALTFDVQYLDNPALNPDDNSIWIYGIRTRVTF